MLASYLPWVSVSDGRAGPKERSLPRPTRYSGSGEPHPTITQPMIRRVPTCRKRHTGPNRLQPWQQPAPVSRFRPAARFRSSRGKALARRAGHSGAVLVCKPDLDQELRKAVVRDACVAHRAL